MHSPRLASLFLFAGALTGQTTPSVPNYRPRAEGPPGHELARRAAGFDRVLHDDPGSGVLWSVGADWKASFGTDGFTFIPFLGAEAPRNFPVQFRISAVHVDGQRVPFAEDSRPERAGDRITYDRGPVREVYDLALRQVEQTFVLDSTAGAVTIELAVTSELAEDAALPGLQFGNELGQVEYGQAWLVRGQDKTAITTEWNGHTIRLQVAAGQRGAGPVVIDPIIRTRQATPLGTPPTSNPDLAYDHTNDVYLLVWESLQSQSDTDVHCEMFAGDGAQIPGTGATLDASTVDYRVPRVAGNNRVGRFLIVMQRTDAGRSQIHGRTRSAGGAWQVGSDFRISNPAFSGSSTTPDVGGESGATPSGLGWPVVWVHGDDIWLEVVRDGGTPAGQSRAIDSDPTRRLSAPRISSGNGRLAVPKPGWLIVYSATNATNTNSDVLGMVLATDGSVGASIAFDNQGTHDLFPNASSPATDSSGSETWFLLTYERQAPGAAARAIVFNYTTSRITPVDLTQAFGFGPHLVRPESDGIRFAVTASIGSSGLRVATLAFNGSGLVMHEPPQALAGFPNRPEIASFHSGGGGPSRYGIAYLDYTFRPARPTLASYVGVGMGVIDQINTGCNSVWIAMSGFSALGESMRFTLSNFGRDVPGFVLGFPASTPIPLCSTCALGLRPDRPLHVALARSTFDVSIPRDTALVGVVVAVQGLAIGGGPCLGGLSLTDTLNVTIQ